ncbi:hypothetical protein LPB260_24370 [Pseudomonas sp. LPB0260]|uniref:hypothetical protein n=1 Tax=Pseudomonas sp. LPB0260 TaxID=2614442 RepID=UPI0015C2A407|nr:hypothetical protein [Pseudomonas sp. LPB0260]QLC73846.1 hypothetical protein LPB260_09420 [Pseudomonas sp. LPB0260]QLC76620.1 hypothetical protein LPB260_24370 [Pseudomonas sp. LPB0260]
MNFLACEGDWSKGAAGEPICTGALVSLTREEMQGLSGSALTWDQVSELQGEVITLFALAFGFLVLKKVLK